jgi:hypothetical protein
MFYASLLTLSKWKLDAATAYKKIPQTHKDYFCVRTSKAERKENQTDILSMLNSTQEEIIKAKIKDDVVIPHVASLHVGIREERATIKVKRRALKAKLKKIEGNETEAQELREQLEQLKQESNQHKMITERNNPEGHPDGHGAPTDKLISRATKSGEKPLTADDHFNTFFDRCTAGAAESKGSDPHSTTQKPTTN